MKTQLRNSITLALSFAVPLLAIFCLQTTQAASWTANSPLSTTRVNHTATLLPNGKVLVVGGSGNSGVTSGAELYDPALGTWTITASLQTKRYLHSATLLPNGKVLVAGGYNFSDG